jgi:hypothetical protein
MAGAKTIRGTAANGCAKRNRVSLTSGNPVRHGFALRDRGFLRSGAGPGKRSIALRRAHDRRNDALALRCGPH